MRRKSSADSSDGTEVALDEFAMSGDSPKAGHRFMKHHVKQSKLPWYLNMSNNVCLVSALSMAAACCLLFIGTMLTLTGHVPAISATLFNASTVQQRFAMRHTLTGIPHEVLSPSPSPQQTCPVLYQRHTMRDIKHGKVPYLFGGRRRPVCTNCNRTDNLWSNFCQYKSHGTLCNRRDTRWLIQTYVNRNWTELLTLTPCDFWPFVKGRTVWVMGDSQALDFYKAFKCLFFEFWDIDAVEDSMHIEPELREVLHKYLPPSCVDMPEDTRVCYVRFDPGTYLLEQLLPRFPTFTNSSDLVVVNFGLHHGTKDGYKETLTGFEKYVKEHQGQLPQFFWQETSAQHFNGYLGEYPGGSPPFSCVSLDGIRLQRDGSLKVTNDEMAPLVDGGWRNKAANQVMQRLGVPIIHSFNETIPLYYYHRDNGKGYECTHFCFPSAQQTWLYNFYRALTKFYNQTSLMELP